MRHAVPLLLAVAVPSAVGAACADAAGWQVERGGVTFNCAWFSLDTYCDLFGETVTNGTMFAKEACCACGGGATPAPETGELRCMDLEEDGAALRFNLGSEDPVQVTCDWFNPAYILPRCAEVTAASDQGTTPRVGCCHCGGGRMAPVPPPTPTPLPLFCDSLRDIDVPEGGAALRYPMQPQAEYRADERRCWALHCPRREALRLQFTTFAMGDAVDSVTYYDNGSGGYTPSGVASELTGTTLPFGGGDAYVSSSGLLRLATDGAVAGAGFAVAMQCVSGPTLRITTDKLDGSVDAFVIRVLGCDVATVAAPAPGSVHVVRFDDWPAVCTVHAYVTPIVVDVVPLPPADAKQKQQGSELKGDRWSIERLDVMVEGEATYAAMVNQFAKGKGQFVEGGRVQFQGHGPHGESRERRCRWYESAAAEWLTERTIAIAPKPPDASSTRDFPEFCTATEYIVPRANVRRRVVWPAIQGKSYKPGEDACWHIDLSAASSGQMRYVNLVVELLDTQIDRDFLIIYERKPAVVGEGLLWSERARMSGRDIDCLFDGAGYFADGNLLVRFHSDESDERGGFRMRWELTDWKDPREECRTVIPQNHRSASA